MSGFDTPSAAAEGTKALTKEQVRTQLTTLKTEVEAKVQSNETPDLVKLKLALIGLKVRVKKLLDATPPTDTSARTELQQVQTDVLTVLAGPIANAGLALGEFEAAVEAAVSTPPSAPPPSPSPAQNPAPPATPEPPVPYDGSEVLTPQQIADANKDKGFMEKMMDMANNPRIAEMVASAVNFLHMAGKQLFGFTDETMQMVDGLYTNLFAKAHVRAEVATYLQNDLKLPLILGEGREDDAAIGALATGWEQKRTTQPRLTLPDFAKSKANEFAQRPQNAAVINQLKTQNKQATISMAALTGTKMLQPTIVPTNSPAPPTAPNTSPTPPNTAPPAPNQAPNAPDLRTELSDKLQGDILNREIQLADGTTFKVESRGITLDGRAFKITADGYPTTIDAAARGTPTSPLSLTMTADTGWFGRHTSTGELPLDNVARMLSTLKTQPRFSDTVNGHTVVISPT